MRTCVCVFVCLYLMISNGTYIQGMKRKNLPRFFFYSAHSTVKTYTIKAPKRKRPKSCEYQYHNMQFKEINFRCKYPEMNSIVNNVLPL